LLKCLLNEQGCIAACRRIAAEVYACSIMVEVLGATRYIARHWRRGIFPTAQQRCPRLQQRGRLGRLPGCITVRFLITAGRLVSEPRVENWFQRTARLAPPSTSRF
jgi:hypothetical protein